jgi:predicted metal-dependent hydrolase
MHHINIEGVDIAVEKKKIRNVYIRISPPRGEVKVTAPFGTPDQAIHSFALSKIDWIKARQRAVQARIPAGYISGEIHYLWGVPHTLRVVSAQTKCEMPSGKGSVNQSGAEIVMMLYGQSTPSQREAMLDEFYRSQIKAAIPAALERAQLITGVKAGDWVVRKMSTRWGTCNLRTSRICFNLELAKKPLRCLEYIAVHELTHLLEKGHGERFKAYMDKFCPDWRNLKKTLNEKNRSL